MVNICKLKRTTGVILKTDIFTESENVDLPPRWESTIREDASRSINSKNTLESNRKKKEDEEIIPIRVNEVKSIVHQWVKIIAAKKVI